METMISSRFFPLNYKGREEVRASSAAVIYKWSFLSGLHNELRKLSGTMNTYYISPNKVSGAPLAAQKRRFGDSFGNVRKMELAQEQNPELPEGGDDLNREASDMQKDSFPNSLLRDLILPCRFPARRNVYGLLGFLLKF